MELDRDMGDLPDAPLCFFKRNFQFEYFEHSPAGGSRQQAVFIHSLGVRVGPGPGRNVNAPALLVLHWLTALLVRPVTGFVASVTRAGVTVRFGSRIFLVE